MDETRAKAVRMQAEPNVTPMIDVLMVLLIIFMVIVPMSRRAVDVQLPAPGVSEGMPGVIVLEVGPSGRLALNRQPVTEARLGARLRALYADRPDKSIIVHGDGAARYQEVVAAIDSARGAGVRVVGLDPRRDEAATVR
jgi:biopolymer transport protein ExbD